MKHTILDFRSMIESVRKDGRIHDYKIDKIEVYEDYLFHRRRYINHKHHEFIEYNLFPRENIGIYKLYQYADSIYDPADVYHFYVDMVGVAKDKDHWRTKDLYIDFIVKGDGKYYVVDIDEFNEAIERKELDRNDVRDALQGLDNILKGYYQYGNLDAYVDRLRKRYAQSEKLVFKSKD